MNRSFMTPAGAKNNLKNDQIIISQAKFHDFLVFSREKRYLSVIEKPIECHYFPRFREEGRYL